MPRQAKAFDLPSIGNLNRSAGSLARQLSQAIREAIRAGSLKPGELLPSTRLLAQSLGVSRGTVVEVFEQLIAEGFLESKGRSGTRVARALKDVPEGQGARRRASAPPIVLPPSAAAFERIAEEFTSLRGVPFAISVPGGRVSPARIWQKLGNRVRKQASAMPAGYSNPQGALALREAIAEFVRKSRSVRCNAGQVIITTGTQQGLFLSCQVLLGTRDHVWVENPAYRGITAILETMGREDSMIRVPVDVEGFDVETAITRAPNATAAFVTPSHQYPLGMPMSMGRRNALLAWARVHGSWIVEDDYDSELRYAGHPFPSLQGLDPDRVIYLGTFSKILFPSLRLGYVVVPEPLVSAFCGARALIDRHPPNAEQHVLAAFIAEGHIDRHLRRLRTAYAEQREWLITLLQRLLPRRLGWIQPSDQGMHLLLWLAEELDDREVVIAASTAGVSVRAVSPMYVEGTGRPGLVLGFGGFTNEQMEAAMRRLVSAIRNAARRSQE
jgi:GntR family transcriptional regulator / MocR family aminotransferase